MKDFIQRVKQWARLTGKQAARPFVQGGAVCVESSLRAVHIRDGKVFKDYGIISTKSVTNAWVQFVVDQLQAESSIFGDFKYHDSGTGVVAENVTDTALGTKVEAGRAVGTQAEGASANIYQSVGTITYTSGHDITEHGLFNAASGVTLMDRSKFGIISVVSTDSIRFTYELTIPAGG